MWVEAYYDVGAAEHANRITTLGWSGLRPISLSVYGDPHDPRYAAVLVHRPGPPHWQPVHLVDAAGFEEFMRGLEPDGFVPALISVTGTPGNESFAAVVEQGVEGPVEIHHGLINGTDQEDAAFRCKDRIARERGLILRSATIYGDGEEVRYAGVWHPNPGVTKWSTSHLDSLTSHQKEFDAHTQLPGHRLAGYRPAFATLSNAHLYCSSYRDDVVGDWEARHNMTARQFKDERARLEKQKLFPICLQGGGSGSSARFAAIFAGQDVAERRIWRTTGSFPPALAGLDRTMRDFMTTCGVRAAQLVVAKNGAIRMSRAYTWAELTYHKTLPTDVFLLASCSKMFVPAAVQALYDTDQLTPATKVYPLLGFSGPLDPRSDEITVEQLVEHKGGYDQKNGKADFTYRMRWIAQDLDLNAPVTKLDIARYMYGRKLDFAPGSGPGVYSNYGYLLLAAVVEKVAGQDFLSYLKAAVLDSEGIGPVVVSPTRAAERPSWQAIAEDRELGPSPFDVTSTAQIPEVYGGDQQIKEVAVGSAGLACSAEAMVEFIHRHAVQGIGDRSPGNGRAGSTPGASTFASSRGDDIDWALVVNTREWPDKGAFYNRLVGGNSVAGSIDDQLNRSALP